MKEFKYVITDKEGIHARPAGELIKVVKGFSSTIKIAKDGKERLIICMLNSGTILPELDANDIKLSVLSRKGEYSDMVNPLLRFRMLSDNIVARVSADNVNAFMR